MFQKVKRFFYFPVAGYFRFFAAIRLKKWNPRIIVITGSSGKTTLLHLVEAQLGDLAKYSHEANSSFGIPFDILDIHRKSLTLIEWPRIFLSPIINILRPVPKEKIYVVECDCDRPNEGNFLSSLLNPEVTLWTNVSRTHSMNFEPLTKNKDFKSIENTIAYEFGYFGQRTRSLVIVNGDSDLILAQLGRISCKVNKVSSLEKLTNYEITLKGTEFETKSGNFSFPYLLPKETLTSILMSLKLVEYLGGEIDVKFSKFILPPGRNSFFKGIKNTILVDSSYNANLDSMKAIINMFNKIDALNKWIVLGDMLELGLFEREEHEKLADFVAKSKFERIILMGPRTTKYTYPRLKTLLSKGVVIEHFLGPKETLGYLLENIKGGETILFKGARFLEGVVEGLLLDKGESGYLARREKIWQMRRRKWGL